MFNLYKSLTIFLIVLCNAVTVNSFINNKLYKSHYTYLSASKGKKGIFSPLVEEAKHYMGDTELNELRAKIILEHSKVISKFVDTSSSKFGQIALKCLFEAADSNNDGSLDVKEIQAACEALGFDWIDDEKSRKLITNGDQNLDEVIDFEEFVTSAPKMLRVNLVKLAKKNGNDLGFLV